MLPLALQMRLPDSLCVCSMAPGFELARILGTDHRTCRLQQVNMIIAAIHRLGYQLGVQLAQEPQGAVTVYPDVLDPLGAQPSHVPVSSALLCNTIARCSA